MNVRFQVYDYACFLKARLTQRLSWSCCRLSVVVLWNLLWATHSLPYRAQVFRGCPCRDPPVCHRVQDDSGAQRQPFCVWLLVLLESWHHVFLALVFVVVFRAHAQLRILTPLLKWKRCSSSQSSSFSVIRIISTKVSAGCGCSLLLVILF